MKKWIKPKTLFIIYSDQRHLSKWHELIHVVTSKEILHIRVKAFFIENVRLMLLCVQGAKSRAHVLIAHIQNRIFLTIIESSSTLSLPFYSLWLMFHDVRNHRGNHVQSDRHQGWKQQFIQISIKHFEAETYIALYRWFCKRKVTCNRVKNISLNSFLSSTTAFVFAYLTKWIELLGLIRFSFHNALLFSSRTFNFRRQTNILLIL